MVKTIVTSELIKDICNKYNTQLIDCYTGFKWIASEVRNLEGKKQYIGGGEESYGYMPADFIRDKDAVCSCALMAEIAAWALDNGMSIYQLLQNIYLEFGFSKEKGVSIVKKGKSGADEIQAMMKNFRSNPPIEIAGSKVCKIKDYDLLIERNIQTGDLFKLDEFSTTSNVLQYFTEDGTKVSVRPSGTEPKIKFYIEVREQMHSINDYDDCDRKAMEKISKVKESLSI